MSKCVICGSVSNLDTIVSIVDDTGAKTDHIICSEHLTDTLGEIREKCQKANQEILDLIDKARQLGLVLMPADVQQMVSPHVSTTGGVLVSGRTETPTINETTPPAVVPPQKTQSIQVRQQKTDESSNEYIDTAILDNNRPMSSVGGGTEMGPIDSFSSISLDGLTDKLSPDLRKGVAKMAIMDGRAGQKLMIPEQRKDGTGTTTIQIVKVTDDQLQESFKRMADDSRSDNVPNFARSGYSNTTRTCPFCRGEGMVSKQACPKCKGSGIISTYS
jgi:hypothetical protein